MIGRIAGRLEYRAGDHVLVDVRGVGYLVYVSDRTMAGLPGVGEAVALFTDLLVREDLLQLFGFPTMLEKEWHKLLMTVQGVGAKASMAILSALGTDGVSRAIAMQDARSIQAAQGVGPKLAQRIVTELKDKPITDGPVAAFHGQIGRSAPPTPTATGDAVAALLGLGVAEPAARRVVETAALRLGEKADASVLIKAALQELGR